MLAFGAVCTACAAPVAAQTVIPTATPNPAIEQARQDAQRAQRDASALEDQYNQQADQLRGLQSRISDTQEQLDRANADAAKANERANALDAQGAMAYANSAAQAASDGLSQLRQLRDQMAAVLQGIPQIIDLTKRNGQLLAENAELRATVYGLTSTVDMQTQQITAYQNEPQAPPLDPVLIAGMIIAAIAIALTCATYFFSNRHVETLPPIVYQIQPDGSREARAADEVIDG